MRRAARNLATSSKNSRSAEKKKLSPGSEVVDLQPPLDGAAHVLETVGDREGQLLGRRRAGLANVIPTDGNRAPARHLTGAEVEYVRHEPNAGLHRIDVRPTRDELLQHVVLERAPEDGRIDTPFLSHARVHREEHGRRGVDRHRRRDAFERDLLEQPVHVLDRIDCDADPSDFPPHPGIVGVVAHLGRKVEGNGETGLSGFQQIAEARVRRRGRAEAGVLAHRP